MQAGSGQRGQASVEYVGAILLVAALLGGTVALAAGRPVPGASSLARTLSCRLLGAACPAGAGGAPTGTLVAGSRWLARALGATSAAASARRGVATALRTRAS